MRESHIARKEEGRLGKYNDCISICHKIDDPEKKSKCMNGCENAFPNKKDGTELPNNFPDLRNYAN